MADEANLCSPIHSNFFWRGARFADREIFIKPLKMILFKTHKREMSDEKRRYYYKSSPRILGLSQNSFHELVNLFHFRFKEDI